MGRHRSGPTTPIDVGEPTQVIPALTPARSGTHRAVTDRSTIFASTRTAGALALVGALAVAGLATTATSTATVSAPPPVTGDLPVNDLVAASRVTPTTPGGGRTGGAHPSATPTATPQAPAADPDDGGRTLWNADFASDGLDRFKDTPWNVQGGSTPSVSGGALNVSIPGGGKRAEVEPDFKNLTEGDEYYFGFSVKLADDFPVDAGGWQVITQWKNQGTGTPPLEVKVQDGHFLLDGDGGAFSQVIGDAAPGRWTHLVLRVKFSSSSGSVSAWQDGTAAFTDFRPSSGTLYAGKSSYLKVGLYRDTGISADGALQFGSYAIGTSRGSVSTASDVTRGR